MKTAIILTGNIRTWAHTKENFKQTFSNLNADIFISTYNLQFGYHPWIKNYIGDFSDNILSDAEIFELFSDINVKQINISDINYINKIPNTVHDTFKNLDNCFWQYIKLLEGINLMKSVEIGFKYDRIIKTRFDLIYNSIEFKPLNNTIIIDSGNVFPNDCIFMTNRNSFVDICNFMVDEMYNPQYKNSHLNPPHGLLHNAIKHVGLTIDKQKIMNAVIRKNGTLQYY